MNNRINFSTYELDTIRDMFLNQHISVNKISEHFKCSESVIVKRLKEMDIETRHTNNRYWFNNNVFDTIDSEEKAYWIGFIWCDGYNCKRFKNNKKRYEVKISLAEQDIKHLEKLKLFLDSNHPIKIYKPSGFKTTQKEVRLLLCDTHFGEVLENKYGMVSNRENSDRLISSIPMKYIKDFIRGVVDAEGSLSISYSHDYRVSESYRHYKAGVAISTYKSLIDFIQDYLYNNKIINSKAKLNKRHIDRDGFCVNVKYCGNINTLRVLNWLYDGATIFLDRKYNKYLEIKDILKK